jgi:hypothetical protein
MGVQVTFDYPTWTTRYPEFATLPQSMAQTFFDEATLFHRNDGGGSINDPVAQLTLLNMLTAHLAQLFKTHTSPDGDSHAVSELVGRVSNASQGQVSLQADFDVPAGTPQWFAQTKYGAEYWTVTAPYRLFRFRPGPHRIFAPVYGGRPFI